MFILRYAKELTLRCRRKITRICRMPIKYIQAQIILLVTIMRKSENDFIIYLSDLIGDSVYALSFLTAIHEKYPGKRVVIVGNPRLEKLIMSYGGIDKLVLINSKKWVNRKNSFMQNSRISERGLKYNIYNSTPYFYKKCFLSENSDALYQLRTHVYKLPEDTVIEYHQYYTRQLPVTAIENFELVKRRVIVINPFSKSLPEYNIQLYEGICRFLTQEGYLIYTNVIGEQRPICGSKELRCSIKELYRIAREIPAVISIRSGILDYLVPSGANIFAIYDNRSITDKFSRMYHLANWGCGGKIHEIYLNDETREINNILDELKSFLETI